MCRQKASRHRCDGEQCRQLPGADAGMEMRGNDQDERAHCAYVMHTTKGDTLPCCGRCRAWCRRCTFATRSRVRSIIDWRFTPPVCAHACWRPPHAKCVVEKLASNKQRKGSTLGGFEQSVCVAPVEHFFVHSCAVHLMHCTLGDLWSSAYLEL